MKNLAFLLLLLTAPATWATDDLAPLSDEFNRRSTGSNWLHNNDVEGWDANKLEAWDVNQTRGGYMHIMPYASSWYNDYTGVLVYKEVSGDFILTINEDVMRRGGQPGRPVSDYSLAGIMIRTPRGISHAAPNPDPGPNVVLPTGNNIPAPGQPGHYATGWQAGRENYIFLSCGYSAAHIGTGANQWHYEIKTTINSQSTLYPSTRGIPEGTGSVTLQVVRRGATFLLLRRHGAGGQWIIENRYHRPDMPQTLQVGITTYTDWQSCEVLDYYHHNRTALTNSGNPDLIAQIDYYRLRRPDPALTETMLQNQLVTGQWNNLQYLSTSPLAPYLGDNGHAAYVPPGQTWAEWLVSQFSPAQLLDPAVSGPEADPDGDGLPNLLDFLTDGVALTEAAPEPPASLEVTPNPPPATLTLRRNPLALGFRMRVEASSDLATWETLLESTDGASPSGPGFLSETTEACPLITLNDPPQPANPVFDPDRRYYRLTAEPLE